jgi:hypothetical protein
MRPSSVVSGHVMHMALSRRRPRGGVHELQNELAAKRVRKRPLPKAGRAAATLATNGLRSCRTAQSPALANPWYQPSRQLTNRADNVD